MPNYDIHTHAHAPDILYANSFNICQRQLFDSPPPLQMKAKGSH